MEPDVITRPDEAPNVPDTPSVGDWIYCFCVADFDVEFGQSNDIFTPTHATLCVPRARSFALRLTRLAEIETRHPLVELSEQDQTNMYALQSSLCIECAVARFFRSQTRTAARKAIRCFRFAFGGRAAARSIPL